MTAPELPFRRKLPRLPDPTELELQIALVARLRLTARRDVVFYHVRGPRMLFLELKARGRKPTLEQLAFAELVLDAGCAWEWADTMERAVGVLEQHGVLPASR